MMFVEVCCSRCVDNLFLSWLICWFSVDVIMFSFSVVLFMLLCFMM